MRLRVRDLQAQDLVIGEGAGPQTPDPAVIVHQQHVVVGGRLGLDEVLRVGEAVAHQRVVDPAEFLRRKHVFAQVEVVAFVIDEMEGQQAHQTCREVTTARL